MPEAILTPELRSALDRQGGRPLRVIDPESKREYVLMPAEVFDRIAPGGYDDGLWTDEERLLLAARAGLALGWTDMDEYDDYPSAPK